MKTSRALLNVFMSWERGVRARGAGPVSLTLYVGMSAINVLLDFCTSNWFLPHQVFTTELIFFPPLFSKI